MPSTEVICKRVSTGQSSQGKSYASVLRCAALTHRADLRPERSIVLGGILRDRVGDDVRCAHVCVHDRS